MKIVIVSNKNFYNNLTSLKSICGFEVIFINSQECLNLKNLNELKPKYIFFPHWSHIIPAEIYENFECIIFHMTDVPFGRGGSPLQNLISRGIYETKISAIKCIKELDAGPVYMKKSLSLLGSAEEIYIRAAKIIEKMIIEIIEANPVTKKQEGEVVCFKRRKPEESDISKLTDLQQVFDYIRMLDAEGYPKAYLETDYLRFEFSRASLKHGKIIADVTIIEKGQDE